MHNAASGRLAAFFSLLAGLALALLVGYGLTSGEMYGPNDAGIGPQAVSRSEQVYLYWLNIVGTSVVAWIFLRHSRRYSRRMRANAQQRENGDGT